MSEYNYYNDRNEILEEWVEFEDDGRHGVSERIQALDLADELHAEHDCEITVTDAVTGFFVAWLAHPRTSAERRVRLALAEGERGIDEREQLAQLQAEG